MRYAAVLFLMLSAAGCDNSPPPNSPEPLEDIHAEFHAEIEKVLPADYSSVDIGEKQDELTAIAKRVYAPRAAELRKEAIRLLAELPPFDSKALDGLVEQFSDDVMPEKTGWPVGVLYVARTWDPAAAAHMMKTHAMSRRLAPKEFGARAFCQRFLPDRVYRAGGTDSEPSLAVKSLQDIFIIKLNLQASGCYAPQEIKWYARKK